MKLNKFLLLAPLLVVAALAATQAVSLSATLKANPPAPARADQVPQAMLSPEAKQRQQKEMAAKGQVHYLSGRETQGAMIEIAGARVQLPADAYISKYVVGIDCMPGGPCPDELPFLVIARGESQLWVGPKSGRVFHEKTAPGQENAFAFLQGVVRK